MFPNSHPRIQDTLFCGCLRQTKYPPRNDGFWKYYHEKERPQKKWSSDCPQQAIVETFLFVIFHIFKIFSFLWERFVCRRLHARIRGLDFPPILFMRFDARCGNVHNQIEPTGMNLYPKIRIWEMVSKNIPFFVENGPYEQLTYVKHSCAWR